MRKLSPDMPAWNVQKKENDCKPHCKRYNSTLSYPSQHGNFYAHILLYLFYSATHCMTMNHHMNFVLRNCNNLTWLNAKSNDLGKKTCNKG